MFDFFHFRRRAAERRLKAYCATPWEAVKEEAMPNMVVSKYLSLPAGYREEFSNVAETASHDGVQLAKTA